MTRDQGIYGHGAQGFNANNSMSEEDRAEQKRKYEESEAQQATALAALTVDAIHLARRVWDAPHADNVTRNRHVHEMSQLFLAARKLGRL